MTDDLFIGIDNGTYRDVNSEVTGSSVSIDVVEPPIVAPVIIKPALAGQAVLL